MYVCMTVLSLSITDIYIYRYIYIIQLLFSGMYLSIVLRYNFKFRNGYFDIQKKLQWCVHV